MALASEFKNWWHRFYTTTTHESIPVAPVLFEDDFLSKLQIVTAGENTAATWNQVLTGAAPPTGAIVADEPNGVVRLALTNANQKQESGLHWNNQRQFALDRSPNFEIRFTPSTLCTDQAEMFFGLAGDYVEGPIAEADAGPAEHIFFCLDGGGAITIHTDDGTTDNNAVATGVTLTAGTYAIARIDCTDPTDIRFYINGNRVAASTTFSANATPTLALQPYVFAHKEAGAGVGSLDVDYVRVWSERT